MAKENNIFDPTAFKGNLPEEVSPGTFLCKGCYKMSTGFIYQDKLCKVCALELIAYSRKAQNHIDNLRPAYLSEEVGEMKGNRKKFANLKYLRFIEEKKEVLADDIALSFGTSINKVYSNLSHYKTNGLIEVAREIFVGNRIKKVYRIKGK